MRVSRLNDPFLRGQLAIAALFLSLGFQYATWAARIPALKSDLDLSAGEVGVLLMAAGVGSAVTFPAVAYLMRRLGSRRLALLSQLGLALALPALAAAPNYPVALLVMCADGVLVGGLNVAMNAQGAALETRHERNTMARLHATFSAGSLLAALVASGMTAATDSVLAHFGVAAVLLAALNLTSRTGLLEQDAPAQDAPAEDTPAETAAPEPARRRWTLPSRLTLWMCCAMVFGTVAEGAMNDWSALYLRDVAEASAELAPLGIAVVSGMMVVARVFADGWRARWGDGRVVLVGSTAAGAGLAAALVSGGVAPALAGFACMGLGIAAVTPCVYAAAARQGSDALAPPPPLIGFIASASSLAWGMGAVAASAVAVALCGTRIRWTATPVVREEAAA
ncbi:MFS transporter [Streptomyces sp. FXJ7.023]|uniref:MFS transporter n=1 Tax=Streptomyces sp. FXJ7.023 TaxID=579932 RepID=UPI0018F8A8B0|nr:MFS transporter [Streptomyces sp. FXJ7.023]